MRIEPPVDPLEGGLLTEDRVVVDVDGDPLNVSTKAGKRVQAQPGSLLDATTLTGGTAVGLEYWLYLRPRCRLVCCRVIFGSRSFELGL